MHDINLIRKNPNQFVEEMKKRFVSVDINEILSLDEKKRSITFHLQELQNKRNNFSKDIAKLKNKKEQVEKIIIQVNEIKIDIKKKEEQLFKISNELNLILLNLPNYASSKVPVGKDESLNELVFESKEIEKKTEGLAHDEIGKNLRMMDFESAAKISGSRFVILKADLARLERALCNFMLDIHVNENGYEEISTPHLVKDDALLGTGQLPKFKEDLFSTSDNKWLIPTAEVTLTNMCRDKMLLDKELPKRYVALTNCFRSEAGAAGQDTKGMIRLHEFKKVELVSIVTKESSDAELERLTKCATKILDLLEIPYRVSMLSSGDMGFSASKTYDIEVWLPSQRTFREISSCSNCTDFQARRMNAKYKNNNNEKFFVHTLNGSGIAVGRALLSILENNQINKNSVKIPKVLMKYMSGLDKIELVDEK
ncbi:MAG: serine--tRNA ligase [Alphaproteobacteria bacterium TMED93]|nr:MAG: serine--tRNA ligase [Alphaproteobacteria bacterium TMED93]